MDKTTDATAGCTRCSHDLRCDSKCAWTRVTHDTGCPNAGQDTSGTGGAPAYWERAS